MSVKHVVHTVIGGVLLLIGLVLLVLPGPGLILVLAGLVVLSRSFPRLERHVAVVRARATKAAEDSVSSGWRLAGSILAGSALIAAGLVWGLVPSLPFSGWQTGSSLLLSGVILFALLIYSYRQVHGRGESG
jgi:hypothetical protein